MAVDHALGIAGGAGGVAHGGGGALVEIGPGELGLFGGEKFFVAEKVVGQAGRIAHDDDVFDGPKVFRDAGERRIERCVDEDDAVFAVIDDEGELVREQSDVQRVDDGAHRRNGVVGFEMLLGVPAEGADAISRADAEALKRACEAADAVAHFAEGGAAGMVAHPSNDFALGMYPDTVLKDGADGELKVRHRGRHGEHAKDLRGTSSAILSDVWLQLSKQNRGKKRADGLIVESHGHQRHRLDDAKAVGQAPAKEFGVA